MDDPRWRRRQNEPPMHPQQPNPRYHRSLHDASQQQQNQHPPPPRPYADPSTERFRPANIGPPASATGRPLAGSAAYSGGYYQEPTASAFPAAGMPQSSMGYHQAAADYGQADTRHAQGFTTGPYNPTAMMYNVQSTAGAQNPGVYDTGPPFPPRQPAALQIMETDVGGPYFPGEPTNTAAAAPAMHPQSEPSAAQAVYHQQQGLQNYSSSMASMGGLGSQATTTSASQNVSMEEEELPAISGLDEAYASYQSALREIFRNIQDGVLATAGQSLLRVSDWLLSHVVQLGLTSDDQNLHSDRIRLWNDFNHAWLGIFQRQKDMMESGQTLDRNQSLISLDELKSMGNELVRLCDGIERHGLVDYQYGVWEERIIEILGECVDLYENHDESGESVSVPSSQQ